MENKTEKSSSSVVNAPESTLTPPRHWVGLEELDSKYWDDPKTLEKRAQEFFDKPVEYIEKLDSSEAGGLARRDFLTVMGASMAMASFACARRPVHKIIPYVVNPENVVPGIPTLYASTSRECPHGCGVLIKTREGRPIKLEGNPQHPVNQGKLCVQAQASILNLYDTDRLKAPLARDRQTGAVRDLSWDDADRAIVQKLKSAKNVRLLTGEMRSDSTGKLIRDFLAGFSNGQHFQFEPLSVEEVAEAQGLSYGNSVTPRYRFDLADVVVSLSSDFLGADQNSVENAGAWVQKRKVRSEDAKNASMSKMYSFETAFTTTGASADERYPVRPGDELKVTMALVHQLVQIEKKSTLGADTAVLSGYVPATVEREIGLKSGTIRKIAAELWESRGKSLVVAGSVHSRSASSLALQVAVNWLNSILGNDGATVDGNNHAVDAVPGLLGLGKLVGEMNRGGVDALIIYRSNPSFTAPGSGFDEALKKVPLVIVISDHDDETAKNADFVLADHHYLENWGDWTPRRGVHSLQQPAISPIHSTRAFEDSILVWSKAGAGGSGMAKNAPDWHGYLQENWKQTIHSEMGGMTGFEAFWESALRHGVVNMSAGKSTQAAGTARTFKTTALAALPKYSAGEAGIHLVLYANAAMMDGRFANNPWLQELPESISSATWDNYLAVSPSLAKAQALKNDDVVAMKAGAYSVELPVYVQPGLHHGVAVAAVGYGRRSVGKVGDGTGVDLFPVVRMEKERPIFAGQAITLSKTQKFYKLATTQWHTVTENRPVISDVTLTEFRKNPGAGSETVPELKVEKPLSLWPTFEYKGYRWGMAIDLNSCTGCGACMIGCQAENNIPVVGRDQVRVSRQMHWIRIDRYYSGSAENPDVIFQPMLCQHCENAPCETVCPVLATVHDDEGLNVQVYNRCVGTRYCQNNCPYKVRRFNFFDHWKKYEGTMNMAWNPDVTVRTRGIMEKCTFCVQRITEGKDKAKDRGEKLKDGDFQTACQQTCPTDAIVFGDINDPHSRVGQLRNEERSFRALETLNTRPAVSYMTKVRNKEENEGGAHV